VCSQIRKTGDAVTSHDENCFDPDYDWLPLEHFAPAVEEVFSREPAFR
jgi:hypothetical protein